ncbi:hypothetical protein CI610_02714 [invertebrate metagenome]|uniref:Uncharacterized protein n=1 Tax=invertebrate metagenome TaxID=1711999 RepID=A0A2H9T562_9ZZZZ
MANKWKRELLDSAADLFGAGGNKKNNHQDDVDTLYRQMGQLTVERDFLARKLDQ